MFMFFANYKYALYIVAVSLAVITAYSWYFVWKRRRLIDMTGRGAGRLYAGSMRAPLLKYIVIMACVFLTAFVLLRPQWGSRMREVRNEGSDVLVALDVSRSMLARDAGRSRLERAKDAVRWIAASLKGDRIGLILFAGDAFLQCPLTGDIGAFLMFLDAAGPESINRQGTDIGRVLDEAEKVFREKRLTSRLLLLITDGEDHEGRAAERAEAFKKLGVSIYVLGIGGESGQLVPADESDRTGRIYVEDRQGKPVRSRKNPGLMKNIAGSTGGTYIDITDSFSGMKFILEIIEDQQSSDYGTRMLEEKIDRFRPFAFLLFVLLSLELMIPERRGFKIPGRKDV